jgi:site-specific DNA recombinase
MARVLGRVRLSRVTDATTSPERQREIITNWAAANGHEVIGWATDLDVSRSVDPLNAPELGPWFKRPDEWDILAAWKLDRVATGSIYLSKVMSWCSDHDKTLVSVTENLDFSTWVGRLIAGVIAGVAEGELEGISERNGSAAQFLIKEGKYRGGILPVGYRAEPAEDKGWRLVPDEVMAPVVREIVQRVLEGERLTTIVWDLNTQNVPTQRDRQRVLNGKKPDGKAWSVSNLRRILSSPTQVGYATHRPLMLDDAGKPIRQNGRKVYGPEQIIFQDDGAPMRRAEPLISDADYRALQALLAERAEENKQVKRSTETPLLLRVIHCGTCGRPMYKLKGAPGRRTRYRCSSVQYGPACGNRSVIMETIDKDFSMLLMAAIGSLEYVEKRYDPGTPHDSEIRDIDAQLETLAESVTVFPKGSPALARLLTQVESLSARREELLALPRQEPGWTYVPTAGTFAERWSELSDAGRNDLLRRFDVRIAYTHRDDFGPKMDIEFNEFVAMMQAVNPSITMERFDEFAREMGEQGMGTYYAPEDRKPGEPLESWLQRTGQSN